MVTLLQNLVRKVASSMAESPPPTTITSLFLKNAPSHVAQVDIPCPLCFSSLAASSHIASAPVVIIIDSVKKTNRLVILEEAWPYGNISTEITYQVQEQAFDYLDAPIIKLNTADTPAPFSPVLLEEWLPNSNDVIKAVKKVLYK